MIGSLTPSSPSVRRASRPPGGSPPRCRRSAQRVRQMIGPDGAHHDAARGEQRVGVLRGLALGVREVDQHEVADARRHFQAELARSPRWSRRAISRCAGASARTCAASSIAATPAAIDGRADVERAANAVERIDDVRGPVEPAEAQRREAVDLRERAATSRRSRTSRRARCRTRNRCAARIRHRPRRSPAARSSAAPACRRLTSSNGT